MSKWPTLTNCFEEGIADEWDEGDIGNEGERGINKDKRDKGCEECEGEKSTKGKRRGNICKNTANVYG